jgi:hypothetical protein
MGEARARKARAADAGATVEGLAEFLAGFVEQRFKRSRDVEPMFVGIKPNGEHLICPTPWRDEAEKVALLEALRIVFKAAGVVRYGMVSEVWLARYRPEEVPAGRQPAVLPRDRQDKAEAVMIAVVEPGRPVLTTTREVIRPWDGGPAHLGPPDTHEGFTGRMVELLEESA